MPRVLAVIPARYASTRFPGKVLHPIAGKSMLQRVYERVIQARGLARVVVATEDDRVVAHARKWGAEVVLTSAEHPSGTDRCQEVLHNMGESFDYVINIQADEPFIQPAQVESLLALIDESQQLQIATLIKKIETQQELEDTGEVKVVVSRQGEALYFSRYAIPFVRDRIHHSPLETYIFYKHVGLYLYRSDILAAITQLAPSMLEQAESLEQLRWLEHGYRIRTALTPYDSVCVETPEDLQKVEQWIAQGLLS